MASNHYPADQNVTFYIVLRLDMSLLPNHYFKDRHDK